MKKRKIKRTGKQILASVLVAAVALTGGAFGNLKIAKASTTQYGSAGDGSVEAGDVAICYEISGDEVAIVGVQFDSSIDESTAVCDIPNTIENKPVTTIKTGTFTWKASSGYTNSMPCYKLIIPDNVTTIEPYLTGISSSFFRDSTLTTLVIGSGLADITMPIFGSYEMPLSSITIDSKNKTFESRNNAIIEKATNKLILGSNQTKIPDDIVEIGDCAFSTISHGNGTDFHANENFVALNSENDIFMIPSGIKTIGIDAFGNNNGTSSVIVSGSGSIKLADAVFIPDTVETIGKKAFGSYEENFIIYGDSAVVNIGDMLMRGFSYLPNGVDTSNLRLAEEKKAALYIKSKSSVATTLTGTTTSKLTLPTSADELSDLNWAGHTFLGWYLDKGCTKWPITEIPKNSRGTIPVYAKWAEARTISYSTAANGGTSTAPSDITTKEDGTEIVDGDDCSFALSTTGYTAKKGNNLGTWTHVGWNTDKDAHASGDGESSSLIVDEDELLYAIFKLDIPVKFTDANGERTENATLWNTDTSGTVTFPEIRTKADSDWTPVGWTTSTEANAETAVNVKQPGDTLTVSSNGIKYYALYKRMVSVDTNGNGEPGEEIPDYTTDRNVINGESSGITAPTQPTAKPGYDFEGWVPNPNPEGVAPVQPGETIYPGEEGITAVYTPISYTVKFHANNGTSATSTQNFTYDVTADLNANTYTYSGRTFKGWAKSANATNAVYTDKQNVKNLTTTANDTIDLYAVWSVENTTTASPTSTPTAVPTAVPTATPVVTASPAPTTTVSPTPVATVTPTPTPTISSTPVPTVKPTASPTVTEFNINYELNDGIFTILPPTSYNVGKVTLLPIAYMVMKTGYSFDGWYDNKYFVGNPITSISQYSTGDLTFYAKWGTDNYKINYELNGGTLEGYAPTSYKTGNVTTLPTESAVAKSGYAFKGWYDNSQYTGAPVSFIEEEETGDKVYYAKWVRKTYSVKLHLNGGKITSDNSLSYEYGDEVILPVPVKEKYTFVGWYNNAAFSGEAVTKVTINDCDKEYYAKWESSASGSTELKPEDDKTNTENVIKPVGTVVTTGKGIYIVNNNEDGEASVTYKNTTSDSVTNLVIPDTITVNGVVYKVTAISSSLITNKAKLKSVKIGKYVKRIPDGMFSGCKALTKVTGGKNVVTIGKNAFKGCKKLNKIAILSNKKLKTIGKNAFLNCKKLKSVTIGPKVTTIKRGAFKGCKNLKKIVIKSKKLKTVGKNAFKGIHKKCRIKVPASKLKKYKKLLRSKGQKKSVKICK